MLHFGKLKGVYSGKLRASFFLIDDDLVNLLLGKKPMDSDAVVCHSKGNIFLGSSLKLDVDNNIFGLKEDNAVSADRINKEFSGLKHG
jgi:hypothetical protein